MTDLPNQIEAESKSSDPVPIEDFFDQLEKEYKERSWVLRRIIWPMKRFFTKIWGILRYQPRFKLERAKRGFSQEDWWGFSDYLARVIAEGCREFIKHGHGWPGDPAFSSKPEQGMKEWNEVLEKIAKGFEIFLDTDGFMNDEEKTQFEEGMKLFSHWFMALWD